MRRSLRGLLPCVVLILLVVCRPSLASATFGPWDSNGFDPHTQSGTVSLNNGLTTTDADGFIVPPLDSIDVTHSVHGGSGESAGLHYTSTFAADSCALAGSLDIHAGFEGQSRGGGFIANYLRLEVTDAPVAFALNGSVTGTTNSSFDLTLRTAGTLDNLMYFSFTDGGSLAFSGTGSSTVMLDPGYYELILNSGANGPVGQTSFNLSVSAVPEPSVLSATLAVAGLAAIRRRR